MFKNFTQMTEETLFSVSRNEPEAAHDNTVRIRIQLLKDARVIGERPVSVDPDCLSSYKRIIKMLVDLSIIRKEKATMFSVEECPENREAMVFLNLKREKIPVFIIAT